MTRLSGLFSLLALLPVVLGAINVDGIYGIVERRVPQHAGKFTFKATEGDGELFTVSDTVGRRGGITVACTTTNACARGLYTYVSYPHRSPFLVTLSIQIPYGVWWCRHLVDWVTPSRIADLAQGWQACHKERYRPIPVLFQHRHLRIYHGLLGFRQMVTPPRLDGPSGCQLASSLGRL